MSPRSTHALHEGCHFKHLAPVVLVSLKRRNLGGKGGLALQSSSALKDRAPDRLRSAETCRLKLSQRPQSLRIEAHANSRCHTGSVSRFVIQTVSSGGCSCRYYHSARRRG